MEQCLICEGLFVSGDRLRVHVFNHHTKDALRATLGGQPFIGTTDDGDRQHDGWLANLLRPDTQSTNGEEAKPVGFPLRNGHHSINTAVSSASENGSDLEFISSPVLPDDVVEMKTEPELGSELEMESDSLWETDRPLAIAFARPTTQRQMELENVAVAGDTECGTDIPIAQSPLKRKIVDEPQKENACVDCGVSVVVSKCKRLKHIVVNHAETPYTCGLCSKSYRDSYNVARHLKRAHRELGADALQTLLTENTMRNRTEECRLLSKYFPTVNNLPSGKKDKRKVQLKRQRISGRIKKNTRLSPFTCSICNRGVSKKAAHIYSTHLDEGKFTCAICENSFGTVVSARHHLGIVHTELDDVSAEAAIVDNLLTVKPFLKALKIKCFGATKRKQIVRKYGIKLKLKRRIRGRRQCQLCVNPNDHLSKTDHIIRSHLQEKRYRCTACGKQFMKNDDGKAHLLREHQTNETNQPAALTDLLPQLKDRVLHFHKQCYPVANVETPVTPSENRASIKKRHAAKVKPSRRVIGTGRCQLCVDGSEQGSRSKTDHIFRFHLQEKRYSCTICGKLFAKLDSAKIHLGRDHPKSETGQLRSLTDLLSRFHDKVLDFYKLCFPDSGRKSVTVSDENGKITVDMDEAVRLYNSWKIQHSNQQQSCEPCGSTVLFKNRMDHVLKRHSDQKRYSCSLCAAEFNTVSNVRLHIGRSHSGVGSRVTVFDRRSQLGRQLGEQFRVCFPNAPPHPLSASAVAEEPRTISVDVESTLQLLRHYRPRSARVRMHICVVCQRQPRGQLPVDHILTKHLQIKRYRCESCQALFKRSGAAKLHVTGYHPDTTEPITITDTLSEHQEAVDKLLAVCFPSEHNEPKSASALKTKNAESEEVAAEEESSTIHSLMSGGISVEEESTMEVDSSDLTDGAVKEADAVLTSLKRSETESELQSSSTQKIDKNRHCVLCKKNYHQNRVDHVMWNHLKLRRYTCSHCQMHFTRHSVAKNHIVQHAVHLSAGNAVELIDGVADHQSKVNAQLRLCFPSGSGSTVEEGLEQLTEDQTESVEEATCTIADEPNSTCNSGNSEGAENCSQIETEQQQSTESERAVPRCALCKRTAYPSKVDHILLTHLKTRRYTCSYCQVPFSRHSFAKTHIVRQHTEQIVAGDNVELIDGLSEYQAEIDELLPHCFPSTITENIGRDTTEMKENDEEALKSNELEEGQSNLDATSDEDKTMDESQADREEEEAQSESPPVWEAAIRTGLKCSLCGDETRRPLDHVYRHLDPIKKRFSCSLCEDRFDRLDTCKAHVGRKHANQSTVLIHDALAIRHTQHKLLYEQCFPALNRRPSNSLPTTIAVDLTTTAQRQQLQALRRSKESKQNCELCGVVVTRRQRVAHVLFHVGKRRYTCSVCKEQFSHANKAEQHIAKHHAANPDAVLIDAVTEENAEIERLFPICYPDASLSASPIPSSSRSASPNAQEDAAVDEEADYNSSESATMIEEGENDANERTPLSAPELSLIPTDEVEGDTAGRRRLLQCALCGVHVQKMSLRKHAMDVHVHEREFKCGHCTVEYTIRDAVKRHSLTKHADKEVVVERRNRSVFKETIDALTKICFHNV